MFEVYRTLKCMEDYICVYALVNTHTNGCGHLVKYLSVKITLSCIKKDPWYIHGHCLVLTPPSQHRRLHLVQALHNACRSLHSMPPVVCILSFSHESQNCSFNKLPLLPPSHCSHHYTRSKQSAVKYAAGLFKIGKTRLIQENNNKNILSCCANTAKTPHLLINEEFL